MVEEPSATGVIVSVEPDTSTDATPDSEEDVEKVSVSPSGSLKLLDKSTVSASPPTVRVTLESEPVGGLLDGVLTVTLNVMLPVPSPSLPVTVTAEVPSATGVRVRVEPETLAVTESEFEELVEKVIVSPSGSLKMLAKSTVLALSPSVSVMSEIHPSGTLLSTLAVKVTVVLVVPSFAVTVMVELPFEPALGIVSF